MNNTNEKSPIAANNSGSKKNIYRFSISDIPEKIKREEELLTRELIECEMLLRTTENEELREELILNREDIKDKLKEFYKAVERVNEMADDLYQMVLMDMACEVADYAI